MYIGHAIPDSTGSTMVPPLSLFHFYLDPMHYGQTKKMQQKYPHMGFFMARTNRERKTTDHKQL